MSTIRIAQEVPAVKVDTPQEVIYRAPVTGKVCRATILSEGETMLKVQGADFGGDVRWIGKDDVLSYVLTTDAPAVEAPPSPKTAPSCDFAPEAPVSAHNGKETGFVYIIELDAPLGSAKHQARYYVGWALSIEARLAEHRSGNGAAMLRAANERGIGYRIVASFPGSRDDERKIKRQKNTPRIVRKLTAPRPALPPVIMPDMSADSRFAYNVERAHLNELYNEWQDERDYHGMVLSVWHTDTPDQRDRLARYEHRYRQQLAIVAQAKSKLSPAHLAWYQEESHRLAAASFYRITADEQLIAEAV